MRKNKGFTLIELMIVIAIIAIIAAIAIPNLLQSRIRANESNAVTQIRNYMQAQSIFQARNSGWDGSNRGGATPGDDNLRGFAIDYRFLYYGCPVIGDGAGTLSLDNTRNLQLISRAHADASNTAGAIGVGPVSSPAVTVDFNGYWFTEPTDFIAPATGSWFDNSFAQVAAPQDSSRTGSRNFFVDTNGTIVFLLLPANSGVAANFGFATPANPATTGWETI